MEAIVNTILFILFPTYTVDYSICELPLKHLDLDKKLEISIGCSYVNGNRVYSDYKLREIYYNE